MYGKDRLGPLEKYGVAMVALAVFAGLHTISSYNYLVFHTIVEVFAIVVACGIFMLAWNSRVVVQNSYLLFLGVAYLFVAALDLVHALAYKGIGIFAGGTDLATQLWISARYIESLALLVAPILVKRTVRAGLVFAVFAVVTALVFASIFYWNVFPLCFDSDTGLTAFKKTSEYVISALLIASVFLLLRQREQFDRDVLTMIVASILLTVVSELCFTLYRDAFDIANEMGHWLKLVSFYLIYRAVIQTGIRKPYALLLRDLKRSNEALESRNKELLRLANVIRHDLGNSLFSVEALAKCIDNYCRQATAALDERAQPLAHRDRLRSVLTRDIPGSLHSIQDSVVLMKRLLEGLGQVVAVGRLPMHIETVDMNAMLRQIADALRPKADACGASLNVDDLPACSGDAVQLNEVFSNLLDNAIKYLDPRRKGEIHVSGACEDDTMVYCVEDNGSGIAAEQQDRVFEIFHRVHPDDAVGGEGLGLSIVQRMVQRHNGRIWLESELGRGSRFFVALPATVPC